MKRLKFTQLLEAAKGVDDLIDEEVHVYRTGSATDRIYVLYKLTQRMNNLLHNVEASEVLPEINFRRYIRNGMRIIGYAQLEKTANKRAYGALNISAIFAEDKFGPLLYDILLQDAGSRGIMPARSDIQGTTEDARKVWDFYYYKRRNEIKVKPIDNIDDPVTRPKRDDDEVTFPDEIEYENGKILKRNPIDYVYYNKSININMRKVLNSHKENMRLMERVGGDITDIEINLKFNAIRKFEKLYSRK